MNGNGKGRGRNVIPNKQKDARHFSARRPFLFSCPFLLRPVSPAGSVLPLLPYRSRSSNPCTHRGFVVFCTIWNRSQQASDTFVIA